MPLKVDLSQFSLKKFRSYSRFDNGHEEKLRSSFDQHFAMESFVRALETAIKRQSGILIGGVPIAESTDGQIVFQSSGVPSAFLAFISPRARWIASDALTARSASFSCATGYPKGPSTHHPAFSGHDLQAPSPPKPLRLDRRLQCCANLPRQAPTQDLWSPRDHRTSR